MGLNILYCVYIVVDQCAAFTECCSFVCLCIDYIVCSLYRVVCVVQEAQLSQRDRAMLCAIEYFAKSLKVTQGHSK